MLRLGILICVLECFCRFHLVWLGVVLCCIFRVFFVFCLSGAILKFGFRDSSGVK